MLARLSLVVLAFALLHVTTAQSNVGTPIQQRIALQPNGMTVSWSTNGSINGVTPTVSYGTDPTKLSSTASGFTQHYDPSITWFHHVVLNNLLPSTKYYWQVTAPAGVNSSVLSFTTAPKVGSHMPFTVSINGDMGLVNEDNTVATMKAWTDRIDLFWHVGDLAYADDWKELKMTYETVQETWMTRMTDIWNQRPYMMCPGNHEATCSEETPDICPEGQRNFTSYRQRYRMPAVESGAVNNMWHSFDYGMVHFISVDTEASYPGAPEGPGTPMNGGPFGDQLAWLEEDLKKAVANRANVPWILASGHRPYYSSGGVEIHSRPAFEPLFNKYDVDVVWWGHVHWYERMYPMTYNATIVQHDYVDATAPIYILSASAGNVEGLTPLPDKLENYTAFLDTTHFGFGLLNVVNATHLDWEFYDSKTHEVLDGITIVKEKRWNELQQTQAAQTELATQAVME